MVRITEAVKKALINNDEKRFNEVYPYLAAAEHNEEASGDDGLEVAMSQAAESLDSLILDSLEDGDVTLLEVVLRSDIRSPYFEDMKDKIHAFLDVISGSEREDVIKEIKGPLSIRTINALRKIAGDSESSTDSISGLAALLLTKH